MKSEYIEWAAFAIGTLGTIGWACGYKYKGRPIEGWFWLTSAFLWIWFAVIREHNGLVARDVLGVMLYATGIVNSFKRAAESSVSRPVVETIARQDCEICVQAALQGPGSRALAMKQACQGRSAGGARCGWAVSIMVF